MKIKKENFFGMIAENAFEFLERSIKEFKEDPKHSIIDFSTAIELIVKARLLNEHWSLIVSKPDEADITKFKAGDFHSVNLNQAKSRLKGIANICFDKEVSDCFESIRTHRNKLVHFYHPEENASGKKGFKECIAVDECRGWFYLQRILTGNFGEPFAKFSRRIGKITRMMGEQRRFLKAKFEILQPEIASLKKQGAIIGTCPVCRFKSWKFDDVEIGIVGGVCLVCAYEGFHLKIICPECGKKLSLKSEGERICRTCNREISIQEVKLALNIDESSKDYFSDPTNGYCGECGYSQDSTVIPLFEGFICLNCLATFEKLNQCEWCSELVTSDTEGSNLYGCLMCD